MVIRIDSSNDGYIIRNGGTPDYRSSWTIAGWVYVHDDGTNFNIIDVGFTNNVPPGSQFFRAERNRFQDNLNITAGGSNDTSPNNSWEINEWHHFAGVYDDSASEFQGFIDGVEVATVTGVDSSGWRATSLQTMAIGGGFVIEGGGATPTGDGSVAYFKAWQRALNARQIRDEMLRGAMFATSNKVWELPLFGSYTDQWLEDVSGNGFDFSNISVTSDATGDTTVAPPSAYKPFRRRALVTSAAPPATARAFLIT